MKGELTVKPKRLSGLALCMLFLLQGCKEKLTFVVPPDSYKLVTNAYAGKTVEWAPTGRPFEISWGKGGSPCDPKARDVLISDGTKTVVCHLPRGKYGDYEFYVGPPTDAKGAGLKPEAKALDTSPDTTTGPYPLHVGRCPGCV